MANDFWFKFCFKDWANDAKPLSLAARGLLLELIIYLRRPECAGRMPYDLPLIIRLTGGLTEQVAECLTEIKKFAILNFEKPDGLPEQIVSRRIIREFEISETNRLNGSLGGNPELKGKKSKDDSVNPPLKRSVKRTANRTSNSNFNSNSDSFIEKGGMGEKSRPHLFRESDIFDKANFTTALQKDERYAAAHIDYYHEVILNWSDQGNRKKNWLATAKNWILRDLREGKLVDKNFNPNIKRNGRNDEALRHGLDQLERIKAGKL